MAIQEMELDPNAGGVSALTFDTHAHNYRKITQVGVDGAGDYSSPVRADVVDDDEVSGTDANKCAAIGITAATQPTSTPV